MSTVTDLPGKTPTTTNNVAGLRWWPAAILLLLMLGLRLSTLFFESPPLPVVMLATMGPTLLAMLLLLWWSFASKASWTERGLGLIAILVDLTIAICLAHKSIEGFFIGLYVFPVGIAAFALPLVLFSRSAHRLTIAVICAAIGFVFWDFVWADGLSGGFNAKFGWRWNPVPEEIYLDEMNRHNAISGRESIVGSEATTSLERAEWPTFRGPDRDGRVQGITLMEDWQQNPPKLIWERRIGPGWSSFSVAGKQLFTQEQRGKNEGVVCLDADTGETTWIYEYPSRFSDPIAGAGPRATPTLAAEGIFALGASGILVCLDGAKGGFKWDVDLKKEANRDAPNWGFSSTPLVTNGLVVVHAGGKDDLGIFAFDTKTGERRWSTHSGDHSYSSAQIATIAGQKGILMESNFGIQFLNIADGKTIWEYESKYEGYRALQPLVYQDSVLLATSLGNGTKRISAVKNNDDWKVDEMWNSMSIKPDFNDFVEFDQRLYGFDKDIFACVDLESGKRLWKQGRYGFGQVLLLSDSGQLLILSDSGDLVLLKATGEKGPELAKIKVLEGKTWNHPVLVGNRLYVRNGEFAACYEMPVQR